MGVKQQEKNLHNSYLSFFLSQNQNDEQNKNLKIYLFVPLIIFPKRTSRGEVKDNLPFYYPKGSIVHTS